MLFLFYFSHAPPLLTVWAGVHMVAARHTYHKKSAAAAAEVKVRSRLGCRKWVLPDKPPGERNFSPEIHNPHD